MRTRIVQPIWSPIKAVYTAGAGPATIRRVAIEQGKRSIDGVSADLASAFVYTVYRWHKQKVITSFRAAGYDVADLLDRRRYPGRILRNLADYQASDWGVMPPQVEEEVRKMLVENTKLIKTIPKRLIGGLVEDLTELLSSSPQDLQKLSKLINHRYGLTGYNMRRLARDQTNKLIGAQTQMRHRQLKLEKYRWLTVRDERVRARHRANQDRIFAWDSPPGTGHPGTEVQCRCVASVIINDDFINLLNTT